MKRRVLLSFLGLPLAAQTPPRPPTPAPNKDYRPRNGECPVCSTMAPAQALTKWVGATGSGVVLVRCAWCSNAFYQNPGTVGK